MTTSILRVLPERVRRTYHGGKLIDEWTSEKQPADNDRPELWIASAVTARNPGEVIPDEGLSKLQTTSGEWTTLKALIENDPEGMLGKQHAKQLGSHMGVLVKLIDSLNRLSIQVHPDRSFAKQFLGSDYGKTEAWYILGGRKIDGEDPYVLLGFKTGITREDWKQLFNDQNIQGMIDALHKIYVKPGEVYFIEGGVPHAIGPGCFLVEIQEPTDYTMRVERTTTDGKQIPDELIHQGTGFEKLMDCFHYDNYTLEQALQRWRITPRMIMENEDVAVQALIPEDQQHYFGMERLEIRHECKMDKRETFSIAVVLEGEGRLVDNQTSLAVQQGDLLFISANAEEVCWRADREAGLTVMICHPPTTK